jgi:hypothetical protein
MTANFRTMACRQERVFLGGHSAMGRRCPLPVSVYADAHFLGTNVYRGYESGTVGLTIWKRWPGPVLVTGQA